MSYRFFSFIIPAHNEEKIIERTIQCLQDLQYPRNRYEIIVVENGSTDATYTKALQYTSPTTKVYDHLPKGVSRARNFGFTQVSPECEWCIFMDTDVFLKETFLTELNRYLDTHPGADYGTTTVNLDSDKLIARFWSRFNNFFYRLFGVLFTIHIIRRDLALKVSYDENLVSGEDIQYGRDLSHYGKYFFMKTKSVASSPRRFEKKGYFEMFLINLYHGITMYVLPESILKKIDWEVIR